VINYLSTEQLLELHRVQLQRYGGLAGIRDRGALESAAARPAMTFAGEDLYPDVPGKAAALMHSLALNHPFVDGNKRAALLAIITFLGLNDAEFTGTEAEAVIMIRRLAAGEIEEDELVRWIAANMSAPAGKK
jgi:death-on-curing protein